MEQVLFDANQVTNAFNQAKKQRTLQDAQALWGKGDYGGASNALFSVDPQLSMQLGQYGQQQSARDAQMKAGQMVAGGDVKGAATTLAGAGDLQGWASLDAQTKKQAADVADTALRISYGVKKLPPEQRRQYALQAAQASPYASVLVPQLQQAKDQDFSDQSIDAQIAAGMSLKEQMDQEQQSFTNNLNTQKFGEEKRHNRVSEGLAARAAGNQSWRPATDEEKAAYNLPAETAAQIDGEGKLQVLTKQRQYSEFASKAAAFADRMASSNDVLTRLEKENVDPNAVYAFGLGNQKANAYRQAQREFINSVLRLESGAAISQSEFESARRQYFAIPGDTKAQIKAKQESRARAVKGMINASQGAYADWYSGGGGQVPDQIQPSLGDIDAELARRGLK